MADTREVEITHGDRVIFPEPGITKRDVVDYYRRVGERILPHLRNRPLVLHRFPDGVDSETFFQKQVPSSAPEWVRAVGVKRRGGGSVDHVVADDLDTLLYVVNQGGFELHTLLAPVDEPAHPEELVLDLDPSTPDIGPVIEAARATRRVLGELDVESHVKSTGSRGIHVHIALDHGMDVDHARRVAKSLADRIVATDPDLLTTERLKRDRGDRVFMDYLRNGYGQHAVVPYSVRARPSAPVALPMDWDEVTRATFAPDAFTVSNVFRRLAHKQDPWAETPATYSLSELEARLDR